ECRLGSNPFNGAVSFDSINAAFLTIFQCITLEGWVDVMYLEMDAVGPAACVYFILLIILGALFVLNLFLAVIVSKFQAAEVAVEDGLGGERRSKRQVAAAEVHERRAKWLLGYVDSRLFQRFIVLVILANTLIMCLYFHGMSTHYEGALDNMNAALSLVFAIEMGLKLYAYGPRKYARDTFNLFDAVVVISSVVELVVEYSGLQSIGVNVSALRALRLFRILKLARSFPGLRKVLQMMLRSLIELNSLFALMSLIMFVFALLGEQLFGLQFSRANGFEEVPRTNFDTMTEALITVFVVMSGEN
ncbi:Ion transport protein-domain-containing protein, partial [Pavlovales sp. CCMP2436]